MMPPCLHPPCAGHLLTLTTFWRTALQPEIRHICTLFTTLQSSFLSSYYKACAMTFPVLLRNTNLAQTTSQYYFVLQSFNKVLPSTTLYFKASTKSFPVLLRTTMLQQSSSQYYFVLQSLRKVFPSTTLYY
jgi:hypothetical protein